MRTIAPYDTQLELFPHRRIINATCTADARNAYGDAAQEIVRAVLGLQTIRINGNFTTCFDAYREGVYYEIKSVKSGGKAVCYDWRMDKEAASGVVLVYAILIHSIRFGRRDIVGLMSASPLRLLTMSGGFVHSVAKDCALYACPKPKKKPVGYNRAGYSEGYRNLPIQQLWTKPCVEKILENPYGEEPITWREIVEEGS